MTLSLENVTCVRGERVLFRDLSLKVAPGEIILVRGENGSGKTSLLRMIAGLLRPSGGSISWSKASDEALLQHQLQFLSHQDALKPALSVAEMIQFWGAMKGGAGDLEAALKAWNLDVLAQFPCGILSAGQRRRVALAQLDLVHRPLWLLDEPTGPLDAVGVELVIAAIARHRARGGVTLIATHRPLDIGDVRVLDLSKLDDSLTEESGATS